MRGVPEDRCSARPARSRAISQVATQHQEGSDRFHRLVHGWGGSLDVALQEPALTATVINYGHLATDPATLNKINAAILGNFAGKDQGIPAEDVKKFEESLKQAGKQVNIKIYPDAGHAFENPNNKGGYRPDDAADAW